jgi:putative membrane protein
MYYWNGWYATAGWLLWFGVFLLIFSSLGNWGYTYRAHRLYRDVGPTKDATDFLNERYAKGDISREEFTKIKSEILEHREQVDKAKAKPRLQPSY